MSRAIALAAVMAIVLAIASPAASARRVATAGTGPGGELVSGPQLVAGQVAWLERRCVRCSGLSTRRAVAIKVTRAGGNPATVFDRGTFSEESGGPSSFGEDVFGFALSQAHVAVLEVSSVGGDGGTTTFTELRAGRRGEKPAKVGACDDFEGTGDLSYSLDGSLLAVAECASDEEEKAGFRLRDLGLGTVRRVAEKGGFLISLEVAGAYVLARYSYRSSRPESAVVYDALGGEVTRVVLPPYQRGRPLRSVAVQSDGALATCIGGRLSWHAPGDTEGTPAGACTTRLAIEADRVAYVVRNRDGRRLMVGSPAGDRRVLADLGESEPPGEFDFDGERVAYGLRTCRSEVDLFVLPFSAVPAKRPPAGCPVQITSRALRVDSRGRARIALRSRRGSSGFLEIGDDQFEAYYSFKAAPGRQVVTVRLSRADRRILRRRGQMRVRVVLSITDRGARQHKVSRTLTLSARK